MDRHLTITQDIQVFKRIVLDPIKITSTYCMSVRESSALSAEAAMQVIWHWFVQLSDLFCVQGCLSPLCPTPKGKSSWWLLVIQSGIWGAEDTCGCAWDNIVEQQIVHHTNLYSILTLCWAGCWSSSNTGYPGCHLDTSCLRSQNVCTCHFKCLISDKVQMRLSTFSFTIGHKYTSPSARSLIWWLQSALVFLAPRSVSALFQSKWKCTWSWLPKTPKGITRAC